MKEEDVAHLRFRQNGSKYLVIMPCRPDLYSTLAIQACHSENNQIFNLRMERFSSRGETANGMVSVPEFEDASCKIEWRYD